MSQGSIQRKWEFDLFCAYQPQIPLIISDYLQPHPAALLQHSSMIVRTTCWPSATSECRAWIWKCQQKHQNIDTSSQLHPQLIKLSPLILTVDRKRANYFCPKSIKPTVIPLISHINAQQPPTETVSTVIMSWQQIVLAFTVLLLVTLSSGLPNECTSENIPQLDPDLCCNLQGIIDRNVAEECKTRFGDSLRHPLKQEHSAPTGCVGQMKRG